MDRKPWAHIAHRNGVWAGVISASLGSAFSSKHEASWKKTVAKDCGKWIADGWEIMTVYSRDEYEAALSSMRMFDPKVDRKSDQPALL